MGLRLAAVAVATAVVLACPGGASAASLYAPTYGTSPEAIAGFARAADGSLAPLPGSPFGFPSTDPGGVITLGFTPDGGRVGQEVARRRVCEAAIGRDREAGDRRRVDRRSGGRDRPVGGHAEPA